ncbi:LysR family transcriptional regulator [Aureimonas sp. Leaf324]|uniref:LysR family transcriptional regulator n=1 Tax=Aureimonas sp. Leaf324 TaxID=1736336 RepID=UPI0006FEBB23|nr:LysR family transcriptional regulator [Aureimonas sp. Leaf324]KQQ81150.1 LysR family transcriptional regulator [Aureimonas sp. Leaf324]
MIDRYHLRYFLAVVDTGNFSRAAGACHVSQPTLSVGIAKLEQGLGQTLFHRSNRRVELTPAGAALLAHARAIEAGFAAAERAASGSATVPVLRLGILSTVPRRWTEDFLVRHAQDRASERLEIVEGGERDLRTRLARGRIDMALTILRDKADRTSGRLVVSEGYSLALAATHPLSGRPALRAEDLVHEPMLVRRHCELLPETSRFFTARGVRPFFAARTTSDDKALAYVRAGLGLTVMPDGFVEAGVARVPMEDFAFRRDLGLVAAPHADARSLTSGRTADRLADACTEAASPAPRRP